MGKNNSLRTQRLTKNYDTISLNSPWLEESFGENQQTFHVKNCAVYKVFTRNMPQPETLQMI